MRLTVHVFRTWAEVGQLDVYARTADEAKQIARLMLEENPELVRWAAPLELEDQGIECVEKIT